MSDLDKINPPTISDLYGTLHPINQTKDHLLKLLSDLGFKEVNGPEIETEKYNFDSYDHNQDDYEPVDTLYEEYF